MTIATMVMLLHYHCIVMMVMMVFWNYSSKDCMLELRLLASLPSHVFPFAAREIFVRNRNCQNMIEIFTQQTRSSNHCVKGQSTMVITQCFKRLFHQNLNSMLRTYFSWVAKVLEWSLTVGHSLEVKNTQMVKIVEWSFMSPFSQ